MASQPRTAEQAEARRQDIRTLLIASVASAVAAVVVSQFWFAGTWIAAALTPVLVALFREAIERPTAKIAERVTADSTAVQPRVVMPPDEEPRVEPRAGDRRAEEPPPMRVYRGKAQQSRRRKIAVRAALITGLLGFVIAFSAITITDLVTGDSIGGGGKRLTFGGGTKKEEPAEERQPAEEQQEQEQQPPPEQQQTQPETEQQAPPEETTPTETAPTQTTPAPKSQQAPPGG